MSPVLTRHFLAETYRLVAAVIAILVLVYLSNRLARYLADVAAGELPGGILATLLGLKLVSVLVILLPAAFYLALLLVLGRMHSDGEMVALAASGFGPVQLYRYVLLAALPVMLLTALLSLQTAPWTSSLADLVLLKARGEAVLGALAPGRFTEAGKDLVYHVQSLDEERGEMRGVFVHIRRPDHDLVVNATRAHLDSDPQSGERFLVLEEGARYDGRAGQGDYTVYAFDRYRVRAAAGRPKPRRNNREALATTALWQADTPREQAELHWRLALPLTVPILALLAVPVSHSRPRQGRYARLLLALAVFVVYVNMLGGGRTLIATEQWPAWLGLWWAHLPPLLLAWLLLRRQLNRSWLPWR